MCPRQYIVLHIIAQEHTIIKLDINQSEKREQYYE